MRTWLHALPQRHHAGAAFCGSQQSRKGPHTKERVPVPACRTTVRARQRTGFREQPSARRTVRALAEGQRNGKTSAEE